MIIISFIIISIIFCATSTVKERAGVYLSGLKARREAESL